MRQICFLICLVFLLLDLNLEHVIRMLIIFDYPFFLLYMVYQSERQSASINFWQKMTHSRKNLNSSQHSSALISSNFEIINYLDLAHLLGRKEKCIFFSFLACYLRVLFYFAMKLFNQGRNRISLEALFHPSRHESF